MSRHAPRLCSALATAALLSGTAESVSHVTLPAEEVCAFPSSDVSGISGPAWAGKTSHIVKDGTSISFVQLGGGPSYLYVRIDAPVFTFFPLVPQNVSFQLKVEALAPQELVGLGPGTPALLVLRPDSVYRTAEYLSESDSDLASSHPAELLGSGEVPFVAVGTDADAFTTFHVEYTAPVEMFEPVGQLWIRTTLSQPPTRVTRYTVKDLCVHRGEATVALPEPPVSFAETVTWRRPVAPSSAELTQQEDCPWDAPVQRWEDVFSSADVAAATAPAAGDLVIPNNTAVLVSPMSVNASLRLHRIVVPETAELVFEDENITLLVRALLVRGSLRIGSPTCRVIGPIRITFWGNRTDAESHRQHLDGYGSKGLAVIGTGRADVFGKRYFPTWTRLLRTSHKHFDYVWLQEAVNWEVGQEVVVVSTVADDTNADPAAYPSQHEVMVIKQVSADRKRLQFTTRLAFAHYAGAEYQGEVALLSRNVVIEGEAGTNTTESDGTGGHVLISGPGATGRFAGVLAHRLGQYNIPDRFPFHLHALGSGGAGSLLSDNAVWESYYRCYVVQETHEAALIENVAFDVHGSCVSLGTGLEENNTIGYNLVARVHPIGGAADQGSLEDGQRVFPTFVGIGGLGSGTRAFSGDASASGFFLTNAHNDIVGNTAVGGWAGYLFPRLPQVTGASRYTQGLPVPWDRPLLRFDGNTAHSTGWHWRGGAGIYVGGALTFSDFTLTELIWESGLAAGGAVAGPSTAHLFENTLVYLANHGIVHAECSGGVDVGRFEFHDVSHAAVVHGSLWFHNGVVTAASQNTAARFETYYHAALTVPATHGSTVAVTDVAFVNYKANTTCYAPGRTGGAPPALAAAGACSRSGTVQDNAVWSGGYDTDTPRRGTPVLQGISYRGVDDAVVVGTKAAASRGAREFHFIDVDGSASMQDGAAVVGGGDAWWNVCDDCRLHEAWMVWICPKAPEQPAAFPKYPQREVVQLMITTPGIAPADGGLSEAAECFPQNRGARDWSNCVVGAMYLWGHGDGHGDAARTLPLSSNAGVTGIAEGGWLLRLDGGRAPQTLRLTPTAVPAAATLRFAVGYPQGTTFIVTGTSNSTNKTRAYQPARTSEEVWAPSSDASLYYVDDQGTLFLHPKLPSDVQSTSAATPASLYSFTFPVRSRAALQPPRQDDYVITVTASCRTDGAGFCADSVPLAIPPRGAACPVPITPTPPTPVPTASPAPSPSTSTVTPEPVPAPSVEAAEDGSDEPSGHPFVVAIVVGVVVVVCVCTLALISWCRKRQQRAVFDHTGGGAPPLSKTYAALDSCSLQQRQQSAGSLPSSVLPASPLCTSIPAMRADTHPLQPRQQSARAGCLGTLGPFAGSRAGTASPGAMTPLTTDSTLPSLVRLNDTSNVLRAVRRDEVQSPEFVL
eukprot:TRINITY_DN22192_c0_g1_i1.p1 TRINITY_DN22192_c0_g1~~TRINITY_DN22192_c0_g1_i1.p1  ORF type:complete len:1410 (+),score=233.46 TRINITY_DN22192_c0_g1_i1:79-4308(+)